MELIAGKPVTVYGLYTGMITKLLGDASMVSFYADGVNMYNEVPNHEITMGATMKKIKRTNEVYEKEDEGCEGGACKI